ncbi:hypothetical protein V8E54_005039 [Elaphomyces granulatus]
MHFSRSLFFMAMGASMVLARLHGHERRHAHVQHRNAAQAIEERGVGDPVTATINGKVVTWLDNYSGGSPTQPADYQPPSATTTSNSLPASTSPISSPSNGTYSTGFGGRTASTGTGINKKGNCGEPYGSNIILIDNDDADKYNYVIQIVGCPSTKYTVGFWNKIGRDGNLDGWYGDATLNFVVNPGETKTVAVDDDTQGAFGITTGNSLPRDQYGGYDCTWGEFDFCNSDNNNWSGFDVSIIQAQAAGRTPEDLEICDPAAGVCSCVKQGGSYVSNAYTKSQASQGGIGGNLPAGKVKLVATLCP